MGTRGSRSGARDQYKACTAEIARFCEFRRDTPGVQDGGFLVRVLIPRPVRREAVFVDNMKEVAHANGVGRCTAGFQ
jgi:hypothetical protein